MFRHLKSQLKELHVILTCDEDHEVPIIIFKNNKNLKSHLVRAAFPDIIEINIQKKFIRWRKISTVILKRWYIWQNVGFVESNTILVPWQNFVLEPITITTHIVIFGKNKKCQIKPITRNVFTNIIWRMTITGFVTERLQ